MAARPWPIRKPVAVTLQTEQLSVRRQWVL